MALQLIAAITLDQDYGTPPLPSTAFSNLNNWSAAGTLTQGSNNLSGYNVSPSLAELNSYVFPSPIEYVDYGQKRKITFKLSIGFTTNVTVSLLLGATVVLTYPVQVVGAGTLIPLTFDANTTLDFDRVKITLTNSNPGGISWFVQDMLIENDSGGSFDFETGDRIIINWDDVAGDYLVQREDNPGATLVTITTGPELGFLERDQVTGVLFNRGPSGDKLEAAYGARSEYKFCDGLNLVEFFFKLDPYSFPYVFRFDTENSSSCTTDIIVCDVQFNQNPDITPSTNRFSNDGQVELSATSSHGTVKYTDEIPGTFQGQFNNIDPLDDGPAKTGLSYGLHTFYAVDQYNCWAVIQVSIPAQPSSEYGEKYRLQYYDIQTGVQSVIKIFERGYLGVINEAKGSGDPFELGKDSGNINNKFDTIKPTFCQFNMLSERHFQYIGLFSQDDRKYKVVYTHGSSSWYGYITPSLYNEPYSPSPIYPINITAIDNLGSLGDHDFVDDSGNIMLGINSVLDLIAIILRKIDLGLNIVSCVNRFAEGMTTDEISDPLLQAYVNVEAFIDDQGNPYKCDVVIESLLKPFGAFITQEDGKWIIIETDSQSQSYTFREYDVSFTFFIGNGLINTGTITRPDIEIVKPTHVFGVSENKALITTTPTLDIIPAYGKMSVRQALKPIISLFPVSLDRWQANISGAGLFFRYFDIEDTRFKGISFVRPWSYTPSITSPFFAVKTRTDSVKISFEYRAILDRVTFYGSFGPAAMPPPDPPFVKIKWRLICKVGSFVFYFSSTLGWIQINVVGTSTTSVAIPTTHATTKNLTTQPGLTIPKGSIVKIQNTPGQYFRAIVSSYDIVTGALVVSSYANIGTGTYTSWSIYVGGEEYVDNIIYEDNFDDDFKSFSKEVTLPEFNATQVISLQLQLFFEGSRSVSFETYDQLRAIPTAIYPAGYKIRGIDPDYVGFQYFRWYTLQKGEDPGTGGNDLVKGNDYSATTNAVLWSVDQEPDDSASNLYYYQLTKVVSQFDCQNVKVEFLPNKQKAVETETISFVNNSNFKENLEVPISSGDLPLTIISDEIYTSIFRLQDGTPTKNWKRKLIAESASLQSLLLKNIGNQYNKPTWRISGSLLIANAKFTSIVKQTIPGIEIDVLNQDFTGMLSPWENFGSGLIWTYSGNKANAIGLGSGVDSTQYLRQMAGDLFAGTRIRVDFALERVFVSGAGSKVDRAVCILWNGLNIVQKVIIYDGIASSGEFESGVSFTIDQDATHISFGIENIVTDSDTIVDYHFDYFRVKGISVVRYYYFNAYSRNDRHNLYGAELVQLIPMIASTDTDIDDTGGGNTGGDDDNGGNNGGSPFNGAYSSAFGGGFNTVLN